MPAVKQIKIVSMLSCPKCKRGTLDSRVPRQFLVKVVFFWMPIKRYKCYHCKKKSYAVTK